jgi:hypothetical protein
LCEVSVQAFCPFIIRCYVFLLFIHRNHLYIHDMGPF